MHERANHRIQIACDCKQNSQKVKREGEYEIKLNRMQHFFTELAKMWQFFKLILGENDVSSVNSNITANGVTSTHLRFL